VTIRQAVEQYIEHKRSLGVKLVSQAASLRSFARMAGDVSPEVIGAEQVRAFLFAGNTASRTASNRCSTLRGFYRYATARNIATTSPLPVRLPRVTQRLEPHVYSHAELRRLLRATGHLPLSKLQPHTMHVLLLVLYGAGLRIGEALRLVMSDVDLLRGVLNIRLSKFYKDRLVPVGSDLTAVLRDYAAIRRYLGHAEDREGAFFLNDAGEPITILLAEQVFRRLCKLAQVRRQDFGRYEPRLHDLRHTFAVHRVIAWYQTGADVNLMLPKLSTYLGHFQLSYTQHYLTMTLELLHKASTRFESFAQPEGLHD
jgi:integrase/recombinase XerD